MNMRVLSVSLLLGAVMADCCYGKPYAAAPAAGEHVIVKRWARCPNGWNELFGNCYTFVRKRRPWARAERGCLLQGGNLASIQSKAEHTFIQDLIRSTTGTTTAAWIGGYDATQAGVWLWSDGRPMTFTDWGKGQPRKKGNQHCLAVNRSGDNLWNDDVCNVKRASVCKKQAGAQ